MKLEIREPFLRSIKELQISLQFDGFFDKNFQNINFAKFSLPY